MQTLGNILWHFPFLGFLNAAATYLTGLLFLITVIGAPVGLGLMELGKFLLAPFGRAMVPKSALSVEQNQAWKTFSFIVMILYLPFGLVLAALTVVQIAFLFVSILGIPVALVLAKSLGTLFNPVNKKCVHQAVSDELQRRRGDAAIEKELKD